MSPLRAGRGKVEAVSGERLAEQAQSLQEALELGGSQLDPAATERARALARKVDQRMAIRGPHTVVALAGATGSGKSSVFNRLVGEDVSTVGARRPTTAVPTGAVWGEAPADELLNWVQVPRRHRVGRTDETARMLDGLVLLDLPDIDSREEANRAESERVLKLADVFVWVTDPQKYADRRLHHDFLQANRGHEAVTIVVLNQVDLLPSDDAVAHCVADLENLLRRDGLERTQVVPLSARTGAGVDVLQQRIANAVAGAGAARSRLSADLAQSAAELAQGVGSGERGDWDRRHDDLVKALANAAGVPVVLDAVRRDYQREALGATGWVFTRWGRKLRPDPLARLRLDRGPGASIKEGDVRAVLGRSSLPPPSPAARASVELATRRLADSASEGMPPAWTDAVHDAAHPGGQDLSDALDQAIVHTRLRSRRPVWWTLFSVLQWLFGIVAVVGGLWMLLLIGLGALQITKPETPSVGILPLPLLLLIGGLLVGLLLAAIARWLAAKGARRWSANVGRQLEKSISQVAQDRVIEPVRGAVGRHDAVRAALERAGA